MKFGRAHSDHILFFIFFSLFKIHHSQHSVKEYNVRELDFSRQNNAMCVAKSADYQVRKNPSRIRNSFIPHQQVRSNSTVCQLQPKKFIKGIRASPVVLSM
jgi:hypothetical protein